MNDALARALLFAKIVHADGELTAEEEAKLEQTFTHEGLDESEKARARRLEGVEEAVAHLRSLGEETRRAALDGLAAAILADGKVSPAEMATIDALAADLGLE